MAVHMSLADQIAELIKPAPPQEAPEDDFESAARVVDKFEDDEVDTNFIGKSQLRIRNADLLDYDERYAGRRVSVKQFRGVESEEESENSEESDENESEIDENDEKSDENDEKRDEDDEESDENDEKSDEDDEESDENDETEDEKDEIDEDNDDKDEMEVTENFSKLDFTSEIDKGAATRSQLLLWDSLLECRIKLQKVLQLSNQLPQFDVWPQFMRDAETSKMQKESAKDMQKLLDKLVTLQTNLLSKYPETKKQVLEKGDEMDEEIESSDDGSEEEIHVVSARGVKRKLRFEEYPEFLAKRHADFERFRDSTIEKWNDRTRLTTGKMKGFNAFDQTALKQIEHILSDKNRLLTRSRTKRSVYHILGKQDSTETDETSGIDPEIFDDDDFYQQLLRELIEKQGSQIDDPLALSHHWAKIQKLRGKMKKKVDTKASKGRRFRYKVHQKLVNFMAPYEYDVASSESRKDLFSSLFGQKRANKSDICMNFLFGSMNNK
uniref:Protein AATF n=1 Tax=Strigamia maritima TaxID=126957 RepID=T1IH21_STRMM